MPTKLITAPTVEPITKIEAKAHLRVTTADDDTYIETLIKAARKHIEEAILNRALITQTWEYYLDEFPAENYIEIPYPKLQSITSLKYKDSDGNETTWNSSNYITDIVSVPGRIVLAYGKSWPSLTLYPSNPITIKFVAGYGDAATTVPEPIIQAILILVAHLYEAREMYVVGTTITDVPFSVYSLCASYRIFRFG